MYLHCHMKTKVQKWGNSLAVRLPKHVSDQVTLYEGAEVDITAEGGDILVRPVKPHSYTLQYLLDQVTSETIHPEQDYGYPVGKEEI